MALNASFRVACAVRAFLIVLTVLFTLIALAFAALALGSLASLNAGSPPLVAALSAGEGLLSGRLTGWLHLSLDAFWRSLTWAGLCCLCVWVAAYLKPR